MIWSPERIDRNRKEVEEIIYTHKIYSESNVLEKSIEEYNNFRNNHPEYNNTKIHARLNTKIEKNYHQNVEYEVNELILYIRRPETDKEYKKRIKDSEKKLKEEYETLLENIKSKYKWALNE